MAHDDPFAQPPSDKTLIVPSPGARSPRPAQPQPDRPASMRFERVDLAALDWDTGLNPLIAAANPLLNLVLQFRQIQHPDPAGLADVLEAGGIAQLSAAVRNRRQVDAVPVRGRVARPAGRERLAVYVLAHRIAAYVAFAL